MTISKIKKRDGRIVDFEPEKITNAIFKAAQAVGGKDRTIAEKLSKQVVELLEKQLKSGEIPTVEQVQDLVEKVLVENGHYKTAKAYILYRQKRAEARRIKAMLGVEDELKLPTNALLILAARYLRKDANGKIIESTGQMFRRVAKAIAEVERMYGKDEEYVKNLEEEFYRMMTNLEFLPNCLSTDTLIPTQNGLVELGNISEKTSEINEKVAADRGTRDAVFFFSNGPKVAWKITTTCGFSITATPEHFFRVIDKNGEYVWKQLKTIGKEDYLAIQKDFIFTEQEPLLTPPPEVKKKGRPSRSIIYPAQLVPELAEIVGYLLTDGYVRRATNTMELAVNSKDKDVAERLCKDFKVVFGVNAKMEKIKGKNCFLVSASSSNLIKFLETNNLSKNSSSTRITVPQKILMGTRKSISAFLRAVFEADGRVNERSIELYSTSLNFLSQVQLLLLGLGIVSKLKKRKDSYRLVINKDLNGELFVKRVNFLGKRKRELAKKFLEPKHHKDFIPNQSRRLKNWYKSLKKKNYELYKKIARFLIETKYGEEVSGYIFKKYKKRFKELESCYLKELVELNQFYDKIKEIKIVDTSTADLFVPGGNTYVANGFVTHNSPTLMNAGVPDGLNLSACFVIPIEDSIESIFDALKIMAIVQKSGGGCIDGKAKLVFENDDEFHALNMEDFYEKYRDKEFYDKSMNRYGIDVRKKNIHVFSFDINRRELAKGKVEFIWKYVLNKGEEKFKIKTNKGTTIFTSAWHPFFVMTPEFQIVQKRADEIKKGDMVLGAIPPKLNVSFDFDFWLVGFITGDGSIGKYKKAKYEPDRLRIYDNCKVTLERINEHLEKKFGMRYAIQRDRDVFFIDIKRKEITSFYTKLREKVYKSKDATLSFITGLFDAEGHVNSKPGIELSTTNKEEIEKISYFLNSIGIKARMKEKNRKDGVDYILQVEEYTSLLRFYELIGKNFKREDKREKLKVLLEKHKAGSFGLPFNFEYFKKLLSTLGVQFKINGNQTIAMFNGKKFSLGQWNKKGVIAKATLVKFLRELNSILSVKQLGDLIPLLESLEVVKSVSTTKENKTFYDLTVKNFQNYLAGDNGLVFIHNTGFSFSRLRPKGDIVKSTTGTASGPISFMKVFNAATEEIKQGGKRRGANMGILRVDHPDILDFIVCKEQEGFLRNFNISVAITDKFMDAVKNDKEFELINPRNKAVVKTLKARAIWNLIVTMAWKNGEPGVIFIDRINRHCNTTPKLGEIESTNPCSEQPLLPYESCNLGSINLSKMLKEVDGKYDIDWEKLRRTVRLAVRFLDNVIDANKYPVKQIEEMTKGNRKIGLGVMGFADMLILLRIPYNSEEALKTARQLMKFITEEARKTSVELGKEKGSFPNFKGSRWDELGYEAMRNATVTTIAPTGSISEIAGCSQGIEPLFAIGYIRNVAESLGTNLIVINPYFERIAIEEGFYDEKILKEVLSSTSIQHIKEIPERIRRIFVTAHDISPEWHVRIQAAFQEFVDNAISKTINFPHDATPHDVEKAFMLAYDLGCLGVTVYRQGSRQQEVLKPIGEGISVCEACELS